MRRTRCSGTSCAVRRSRGRSASRTTRSRRCSASTGATRPLPLPAAARAGAHDARPVGAGNRPGLRHARPADRGGGRGLHRPRHRGGAGGNDEPPPAHRGTPGQGRAGHMLECPLPDGSVDCVVSIGCFHHTGNLQRCIDETWRVLRPGGRAFSWSTTGSRTASGCAGRA